MSCRVAGTGTYMTIVIGCVFPWRARTLTEGLDEVVGHSAGALPCYMCRIHVINVRSHP